MKMFSSGAKEVESEQINEVDGMVMRDGGLRPPCGPPSPWGVLEIFQEITFSPAGKICSGVVLGERCS